jgi:hypothetical protein
MLTGRWFGGTRLTSFPSINIYPALGVSKPASIRNKVVLPHPDGPSSAKNSRSLIASDTLSTAVTPPSALLTPHLQ